MYFPKSQIKPNLYTNGGEFSIATTNQEYIGYYFKTSTGKYYTGRNQDDRPNEELTSLIIDTTTSNTPLSIESAVIVVDPIYSYVTNIPVSSTLTFIPIYSPTSPTQQDYQNGEFQRYFCKKTNQIQYIEINLDQFSKLKAKDPQIEFSLYEPFTITWILTGNKENVAKVNRNIVELAEKRNRLPKLGEYLRFDYIKYYQ
jgi:hypothetical protein